MTLSMRKASSLATELVFGIHPVLAALSFTQRTNQYLYIRNDWYGSPPNDKLTGPAISRIHQLAIKCGLPILPVDLDALSVLVNGRPHQGVALGTSSLPITELTRKTMTEMLVSMNSASTTSTTADSNSMDTVQARKHNRPILLLIDHLTDVMNMGSILRSAVFFGVSGILLSPHPCVVPSTLVSKLSVGAMESLRFFRMTYPVEELKLLSQLGFLIVGTAGESESDSVGGRQKYRMSHSLSAKEIGCDNDSASPRPLVLALGSESRGLSQEVRESCDILVRVVGSQDSLSDFAHQDSPQPSSLNVAVATGILLYQLTQLRHSPTDPMQSCFRM